MISFLLPALRWDKASSFYLFFLVDTREAIWVTRLCLNKQQHTTIHYITYQMMELILWMLFYDLTTRCQDRTRSWSGSQRIKSLVYSLTSLVRHLQASIYPSLHLLFHFTGPLWTVFPFSSFIWSDLPFIHFTHTHLPTFSIDFLLCVCMCV